MTAILGISAFYHDSAAALIVDGQIVAAVQEERFTRKKHDEGFPTHAISYCLEEAGLGPDQLDYVGFYDKPLLKFERLLETYLAYAPGGFRSFAKAIPPWLHEKLHVPRQMSRGLRGKYTKRFVFSEHHESHAASAFFPSPFDEAAILTLDGVGEWATAGFGYGRGNQITLTHELRFPHSLGLLYSAFTYFCGFKVNSGEHKLMGLAPYGEPKYQDVILDKLLDLKDDGSFRMDMSYFNYCQGLRMTSRKFDRLFGGPPRKPESPLTEREMDLAASVQKVTEEIMLRAARHVHDETGMKNLCLAGGVALNCVAGGRILREGPFENVWIQPAAGDAGGALGVALFIWHQLLDNERNPGGVDSQRGSLLGPSYSNEDVRAFLDGQDAEYQHFDDEAALCRRVADLLASEKVVGWVEGRMEFGPRALGSRSILGDPRSRHMQAVLNRKIKFRESFRPFAPAVLRDRVSEYFQMRDGEDSPYMLLVAPVAHEKRVDEKRVDHGDAARGLDKLQAVRSEVPAVTHVDCSARVQTVDAERHGRFYKLLKAFEARTGCPVLINTSFNVRGEPIVCTPEQAYRCFMATQMDALVMEDYVLVKSEQAQAEEPSVEAYPAEFQLDEAGRKDSCRVAISLREMRLRLAERDGYLGKKASMVRVDRDPPRWQLAIFGGAWLVFFSTLGLVLWWRGLSPAVVTVVWAGAVAVPAVGWAVPGFMRIVYLGMAYLALPPAVVVSHVLLAAVFYLVLAPTGLATRILGYDPMNRRFDEEAESYWVPRETKATVSRYFRQF